VFGGQPGLFTDTYHHDANGSTTGVYHGATGTRTDYAWDAAGRLKRVQRGGGQAVTTFGYDGDGVRVSKTHGVETTRYVNNTLGLSSVLQELTGPVDAPVARTQVPGVGQHDASKANTPDAWAYTHADATNGRLMTDANGTPSKWWDYDPWGTVLGEGGTAQTSFDYAGEQRDKEVGLIFLRARSYDPALGRFLSRDSYGGQDFAPQSWNRYTYAENDPVNHVDPSGHKRRKIKWANGADPDDDDRRRKKARACRNPGQYTGSCRGGPPNRAYLVNEWDEANRRAAEEARRREQAEQLARQRDDNRTPGVEEAPLEWQVKAPGQPGGSLHLAEIEWEWCRVGFIAILCFKEKAKETEREKDRGIPFVPPPLVPDPSGDDDDDCDCVYRALRSDEVDDVLGGRGIERPQPWAQTTPDQHLTRSRHRLNPWISTTRDRTIAEDRYASGEGYGGYIAVIDLGRVRDRAEVLDVSDRSKPDFVKLKAAGARIAGEWNREVIIRGYVPGDAVVRVYAHPGR
jgi:RHS repeat-associated protein